MCSWQNIVVKAIIDFKIKGHNFNQTTETISITRASKLDMSYDFYINHNMPADEWKLNALANINERLINKLKRNWRHASVRKFEYVPFSNEEKSL